jgi:hypothetical protein
MIHLGIKKPDITAGFMWYLLLITAKHQWHQYNFS